MSQVPLELYPYYWRLVLYGAVCSVILMGSSHHGYAVFFLHELWYNHLNKSTRPLEEAQQGGYLKRLCSSVGRAGRYTAYCRWFESSHSKPENA